jgi:hypothetical protein
MMGSPQEYYITLPSHYNITIALKKRGGRAISTKLCLAFEIYGILTVKVGLRSGSRRTLQCAPPSGEK